MHASQAAAAAAMLLASGVCYAQTWSPGSYAHVAPSNSTRFPASWYPEARDGEYIAPVQNAPYTATAMTTARALDPATGTETIVHQTATRARDAAGRTRDDSAGPESDEGGRLIHHIQVRDPVSHCEFYWMEPPVAASPEATVHCSSPVLHYAPDPGSFADWVKSWGVAHASPDVQDRVELLGARKFGDVEALGVRHTTTNRNEATGKPVTAITELWYSPELQLVLQLKSVSDLASGNPSDEHIDIRDTAVHRGEPDAALFYPPPGYAIKLDR